MEDWARKAMLRWPDVPALYGWLALDRRGHWLIQGEPISRPQIIDTINANYEHDARGCWYFQNGPQRGYVAVARAPLILRAQPDGALLTHTGRSPGELRAAWLDDDGGLWLATELGPAALSDDDLGWLLERLRAARGEPVDETALAAALAIAPGEPTALQLAVDATCTLPLRRIAAAQAPAVLGFVREPQP